MIIRAASCSACIDEPHRRFTVTAGTGGGISASSAALRAMLKPAPAFAAHSPSKCHPARLIQCRITAPAGYALSVRRDLFCPHVTKRPLLNGPSGHDRINNYNLFHCTFKSFSGCQPGGQAQPGDNTVRYGAPYHADQPELHTAPEVLILLGHIEILRAAERIQPAERAAVERREAQAIHQCHIGFCRAGYNAFFQAPYHFVDHGIIMRAKIISSSLNSRFGWLTPASRSSTVASSFRLALVVFFITL